MKCYMCKKKFKDTALIIPIFVYRTGDMPLPTEPGPTFTPPFFMHAHHVWETIVRKERKYRSKLLKRNKEKP